MASYTYLFDDRVFNFTDTDLFGNEEAIPFAFTPAWFLHVRSYLLRHTDLGDCFLPDYFYTHPSSDKVHEFFYRPHL